MSNPGEKVEHKECAKCQEVEKKLAETASELKQVKRDLESEEFNHGTSRQRIDALEADVADLQHRITTTSDEREKYKRDDAQKAALLKMFSGKQALIDNFKEIDRLRATLGAKDREIATLKKQLQEAYTDAARAQQGQKAAEDRFLKLEATAESMQRARDGAQKSEAKALDAQKEASAELAKARAALEQSIEMAGQAAGRHQAEVEKLRRRIDSLNAQVTALNAAKPVAEVGQE